MSKSIISNKYFGLIIGFIVASFVMYTTITVSFAHKSIFMFLIGTIASIVIFFRFTSTSFRDSLNNACTPFSFSEQNQNNTSDSFTSSISSYEFKSFDSPSIETPNYDMSPSYSHMSSNIFNHDR